MGTLVAHALLLAETAGNSQRPSTLPRRTCQGRPKANLFTLTVGEDDRVDMGCGSQEFETFYGLDPAEVERPNEVVAGTEAKLSDGKLAA